MMIRHKTVIGSALLILAAIAVLALPDRLAAEDKVAVSAKQAQDAEAKQKILDEFDQFMKLGAPDAMCEFDPNAHNMATASHSASILVSENTESEPKHSRPAK